ncbi:ComEC/Rec2 family competence protein [Flavobacterium cauense]|nr:ComEC/Rec2 family competence protein [Flavobacterium cauense]
MKFPIIPIALFFVLGIVSHFYWKPPLMWLVVTTSVALLIFGFLFWTSKKHFIQKNHFGIGTYFVSFSIGILTHALHFEPGFKNHYSHFLTENNTLQGTIAERLKPNAFSEKYYFRISKIDKKAVFGKILLMVPKKELPKQFHAGEKITILTALQPITKSSNPYQFDYAAYLERQQVYHQLNLKSGNHIKNGIVHNFDYYVERYRSTLLNSFSIHHFSSGTENIIRALLLGQRQDMDIETSENYTNAGVIHILAISGLHIAILYAMLLFLLKPLQRFRNGKLLQFVSILAFLWLFAILSGLSASVVRSVVMFSFVSLGLYLNKSGNIYNILTVSMLVMLLFQPDFLFDVGFQLSYIAVFAIVWLQPFYKSVKPSRYKIVNYFVDVLVISFVAQLGVLPLSLYYFNQLPLLFFMANLVVIPLSSFALILGIIVLVFNFIAPALAIVLGKLLSVFIEIMNQYIAWIASFKEYVIKDIPFSFSLLLVSYLALIGFILWLYKKRFSRLIFFLLTAIALQLSLLSTFSETKKENQFVIFNNKKSTLITEKNNQTILVYTNDSLPLQNKNLIAYNRGKFNRQIEIRPLQNVLVYNDKKILIVDSIGVFTTKQKPDIVLLTQSPKINLIRLINNVHPKAVIADATNYKSYVKRWKATCEKEKIPFHATAEKGFYTIEN